MRKLDSNLEVEVKYILSDKYARIIRSKILLLPGVKVLPKVFEKMTMLDSQDKRLFSDDARLRYKEISGADENNRIEFSYKRRLGVNNGIKIEEEIETSLVADNSNLINILNKIGFLPVSSYERFRESIQFRGAVITIDQFPFGFILEIEGSEFNILRVCKKLNLSLDDSYPRSCDDVYSELCKTQGKKAKKDISFDDKNMPKISNNIS